MAASVSVVIPIKEDHFSSVSITDLEKQTFDWNHVKKIFTNALASPSSFLELKPLNVSPTIERLDKAFREAMFSYETMLDLANGRDLNLLNNLQKNKVVRELPYMVGGVAIGGAIGLLSRVKYLNLAILAISCLGLGWLLGERLINSEITRDSSVNRRTVLIQIAALENKRQEEAKTLLQNRAMTILKKLKELSPGEKDLRLVDELEQLYLVYNGIFEGTFEIENVKIQDRLLELKK